MGIRKYRNLLFSALLTFIFIPTLALAGIPEVSNVMVTDVTTRSFSVIWAASEASNADIEVYLDENGTISLSDLVVTPHPVESGDSTIRILAENQGVMKVRVSGLDSNTSYYFRTVTTSKSTSDITYYPDAATLMEVATESSTVRTTMSGSSEVPFSNDLIIEPCYLEDGTTPAEGTLLLATVKGGHHPITAFVGDGIELPYAMIDLNNMFSRDTFENLDLLSGENLTLLNFRGLAGNSIVSHRVPSDASLSEIKTAELGFVPGSNMVSFQLEPSGTSVLEVLSPIIDDLSSIYTFDTETEQWVFYEKDGWSFLNTLNNVHSLYGYYLFIENEVSLKVHGSINFSPIPLKSGVGNLVGYNSIETIPLMEAIDPIFDNIESIWTYSDGSWVFYDKNGWSFLNTLEYIEPGRSYWIYVSEDCEWW